MAVVLLGLAVGGMLGPGEAVGQSAPTPTPTLVAEPVVPAATRPIVTVPPRPGQPTWTATPTPTSVSTPTPTDPPRPTNTATPTVGVTEPAATPDATPEPPSATPTTPARIAAPENRRASALARGPAQFGYGVNVVVPDAERMRRVSEAGFGWIKTQVAWGDLEPQPGDFVWLRSPDNVAEVAARAAESVGVDLVLRVDRPPSWANGGRGPFAPPDDPLAYGRFMQALAERLRGRVVAYELWNEPNLAMEWGDRDPDPVAFARLLNAGYEGVKSGDPEAIVISGALVATGWTKSAIAMDDLEFLAGMARAGAKFDVLGVHPYGFAAAPDGWHTNRALQFRRAELWRQAMVNAGWADRPMWATEFNWLVDPAAEGVDCDWPDRDWQRLPPSVQAEYLVTAFNYARDQWPWMGPMFVFNLDMAMVPHGWSAPCEQMRWYSLLRPDGSPRPAFVALREMPKRSR